jgi:hypothetical protein
MTSLSDALGQIKFEALHGEIDLDSAYRSGWWHRPYTAEELNAHPDKERILATIEAVVRAKINYAFAILDLEDNGDAA